MTTDNVLLSPFNTEYSAVPFSKVKNEHYLPALEEKIKKSKIIIDEIANEKQPSFENIIEKLEHCDEGVQLVSAIFFNLNSAESNEEMQEIAKKFTELSTDFSNDIMLNEKLFKNVEQIWGTRAEYKGEELRLLENTYKRFKRNGANLDANEKEKLRKIDRALSAAQLEFGDNLLADSNSYELFIENESEVEGLSVGHINAAKELATEKGQEGKLCFNFDFPSFMPFMKSVKNRTLREKLYRAFSSRAFAGEKYDNSHSVKEIVNLRMERAHLLGYENHASFVLEERMAESPERTLGFINNLLDKSFAAAKRDAEELRSFANKTDGIEVIEKWDIHYYMEKLKKEKFDLSDEVLKPYFELNSVLQGAFTVANKLYGLTFERDSNIDTYHKDVQVYKVLDGKGDFLSLLYADFYPRSGKRSGAWMTSFLEQGASCRPHVSIVCNFPKPSKDCPSLLTFDDSLTLFHEFGHALHGMMSKCHYKSLSGTNVFWDFVELPSQIMENWVYEKECLEIFAKHYQTKEVIPYDLIEKIRKSSQFFEGHANLRQLSFCFLDMNWHTMEEPFEGDVAQFEKNTLEKLELWPAISGTCMSTSFGHIFKGGYSAGYYSYKWAEVLDADAFESFKEGGIFNQKTADSFRQNILEKGGTDHPMNLYKNFKGREPNPDALLRRSGLL